MASQKTNINLRELDWDSSEFGFKCGILELINTEDKTINWDFEIKNIVALAKKKNYRFVTFKVDSGRLDILNSCIKNNGSLIDTELTFYKETTLLREKKTINSSFTIQRLKTYWDNSFYSLTKTLQFSRFFIDTNIPKHLAEKVWNSSIFNSCNERANYSIICFDGTKPIGLMNIFEQGNTSNIFLIAVLPEYQSSGIGRQMMLFYENSIDPTIKKLTVETQLINYGAQKFYVNMGYKHIGAKHIAHFWL